MTPRPREREPYESRVARQLERISALAADTGDLTERVREVFEFAARRLLERGVLIESRAINRAGGIGVAWASRADGRWSFFILTTPGRAPMTREQDLRARDWSLADGRDLADAAALMPRVLDEVHAGLGERHRALSAAQAICRMIGEIEGETPRHNMGTGDAPNTAHRVA